MLAKAKTVTAGESCGETSGGGAPASTGRLPLRPGLRGSRHCFGDPSPTAVADAAIASPRFRSRGRTRPHDRIRVSRPRRSDHCAGDVPMLDVPLAGTSPFNHAFSDVYVSALVRPVGAAASAVRGEDRRFQRRLPRDYSRSELGRTGIARSNIISPSGARLPEVVPCEGPSVVLVWLRP